MKRRIERNPLRHLLRDAGEIRREVSAEIEFHLEMRIAELERRGLSPAAAREEALRLFGDMEKTRMVCVESDVRSERRSERREYLGEIIQDLGHGLRQLRHRPVFAATAILTLALGIGATTAIFSAADHVLLRPLPYGASDRVVTLWETDRRTGENKKQVSPGNFLEWRNRSKSFAALGLAEPSGFDLTGDGPPQALPAWRVTEGFFESLSVRPILGRAFSHEEYLANSEPVVLISHGLWQRRYGSDPSIVGRRIQLDFAPTTVAGVLPSWLEYPKPNDLWAPKRYHHGEAQDRTSSYHNAVARLLPGVTLAQAQAEMDQVASALAAEYPQTNHNRGIKVVPLEEHLLGGVRPALLVLLGAVTFVLLIACANVAGLLLAWGSERAREFGLRAALGAGQARLARQLVTENLLLAMLGGGGAFIVARLGIEALKALSPPGLPRVDTIAVDARVLAFAMALTLLAAMLFGLGPALRFSRPDPVSSLRGGRSTAGPERSRLRRGLVIAEIALSVVLLIGAGLLVHSFVRLLDNNPGFSPERRVALQLFILDLNPKVEQRLQRVAQIAEAFRSTPGVYQVGVVSALPFHPHQIAARGRLLVDGRPAPPPGQEPTVFTTVASPEYFEVVGIPLRRGRPFTTGDRLDAPAVALINDTLARNFFPSEDAIGKNVTIGYMGRPVKREIVGIVGDVRPTALDSDPRPELYIPYAQSGTGSVTFVARTRTDPAGLIPALTSQVWQIDPDQAVYHSATLEGLISDTLAQRRFNLVILTAFSMAALLLATIGIYGLISFSTSQRTHEIGVRMALGARSADVVRMIVAEGIRLGIPGVLLGIAGALLLSRFMERMLYGVTPTDPWTFLEFGVLSVLISALAAYVPARRAARGDPVIALRQDY
jgi:putative ABC transport system permease protein